MSHAKIQVTLRFGVFCRRCEFRSREYRPKCRWPDARYAAPKATRWDLCPLLWGGTGVSAIATFEEVEEWTTPK